MVFAVIILIIIIPVIIFVARIYIRLEENKENSSPITDNRPVYADNPPINYKSSSNQFVSRLTALWVEKSLLDHYNINCFHTQYDKTVEDSIELLKSEFNIKSQEDFSRQLYFFQDDSYKQLLLDFIATSQEIVGLYKGSEEQIAKAIMKSYQKASYITQFYNFKTAIVPLEGGNTLSVELYGASIALFILRIGINTGYATLEQFEAYSNQLHQKYSLSITDWEHYYNQWLLAHLFYLECSYNDRYAIHMSSIKERVNNLTWTSS